MPWIKKVNRKHASRRFFTLSREEAFAQSERDEQEIVAALSDPVMRERQDQFERMLDRDAAATALEI